jgi:transposase
MKVLIGVDPHKSSVAVAAVNEVGELVECTAFPQNRAGLRTLERWAKRFPERRWAVENVGGLGRHLAQRLAAAGESVVDVAPKLSARMRVLSTGNARKNDGLDALATALAAWRNERLPTVYPEAAVEVLRLLSERRYRLGSRAYPSAQPPARTPPAGPHPRRGSGDTLNPSGRPHPARHTFAGRRGPRPSAVGFGDRALRIRALERKIADLNERIEAEVEASGTGLIEIFGVGPIPWPLRSSGRSAT